MDPRLAWLSENFRVADFLGNHSVYSRGVRNEFGSLLSEERKLANARALCENALEPLLSRFGPLSIAYGYISPAFSRATVKYQDPDKPSHHRWDLGAAADIVVHEWVQGPPWREPAMTQLFANEHTCTSPALLAHEIDDMGVPYSRLISYSESPYLCLAVSATEVDANRPRKAFYENRFAGVPKAKPQYLSLATPAARARVKAELQKNGLPVPWFGGGFPSYHGGGIRQYQHMQVSKYTTVLDWLFNLKSISEGIKNIPALTSDEVQDAFAAAGLTYDWLHEQLGLPRLAIIGGYVCRSHPEYNPALDWRNPTIDFEVAASVSPQELMERAAAVCIQGLEVDITEYGVRITLPVADVLDGLLG